jgi:hypothetical protein
MGEQKGPPESGNTSAEAEIEEGDGNDRGMCMGGMRRMGEATRERVETQAGGAACVGVAGAAYAGLP